MLEADRLRPRSVCGLGIGIGEFAAALSRQSGLERMIWRPPDFAGETISASAQGFDHRRKQQRFADRDDLGPEALLRCLRPEGRKIRWNHIASHDLGPGCLE